MKHYTDWDKRHIWHPFTQAKDAPDPICIVRADGNKLYDQNGQSYLDMISSWWVNVHGHAHPKIASAIAAQAHELEQVIFADFTHPPAAEFAYNLVKQLKRQNPSQLNRVFFSDSGSTSVEIALKAAIHYWSNRGKSERTGFIAFEGAYHGDTVGAMSLGRSNGFFRPYEKLLFDVTSTPFPDTWIGDDTIDTREQESLDHLRMILQTRGGSMAALIVEPVMQGASGMRSCRPSYIRRCVELAREYDLLVIFDEVMTGFGRLGRFCAYELCDVVPDILCLAKGISGGFMPLAVTVFDEKIYHEFLGQTFDRALAHGHSYTANPIACAAANASLALFKSERTMEKIQFIADYHAHHFTKLGSNSSATRLRHIGSIAALNIDVDADYGGKLSQDMKLFFLNRGVLIRPLGNVIYLLPPYCTSAEELQKCYDVIGEALSAFGKSAISRAA